MTPQPLALPVDDALRVTRGARAGRGGGVTITAHQLLLYAGALLILFVTPGPVWVALTARALSGGFRQAWPLAVGVTVGDILWPLLAILRRHLDRLGLGRVPGDDEMGGGGHLPVDGLAADPAGGGAHLGRQAADAARHVGGLRRRASR
jgi:hypothetical protein